MSTGKGIKFDKKIRRWRCKVHDLRADACCRNCMRAFEKNQQEGWLKNERADT